MCPVHRTIMDGCPFVDWHLNRVVPWQKDAQRHTLELSPPKR